MQSPPFKKCGMNKLDIANKILLSAFLACAAALAILRAVILLR